MSGHLREGSEQTKEVAESRMGGSSFLPWRSCRRSWRCRYIGSRRKGPGNWWADIQKRWVGLITAIAIICLHYILIATGPVSSVLIGLLKGLAGVCQALGVPHGEEAAAWCQYDWGL